MWRSSVQLRVKAVNPSFFFGNFFFAVVSIFTCNIPESIQYEDSILNQIKPDVGTYIDIHSGDIYYNTTL